MYFLNLFPVYIGILNDQNCRIFLDNKTLLVIGIATLIAVIQHEYAHIDPALVGLALSYSLPLTGILSAFMRDFLSTELGFISVERISQYSNLQS